MDKLSLIYQERSYEFNELLERQRDITKEREKLVSTLSSLYLERKRAKQEERESDYDNLKKEVISIGFKMKTMKDNWVCNLKGDAELIWLLPEYYDLSILHARKKIALTNLIKGTSNKREDLDTRIEQATKKLKALKEDIVTIQRKLDEIQVYHDVDDYTTLYMGLDVFMIVTRYTISIRKKIVTHKNTYIYFKRLNDGRWYKSKFDALKQDVASQIDVARLIDDKENAIIDKVEIEHLRHLSN